MHETKIGRRGRSAWLVLPALLVCLAAGAVAEELPGGEDPEASPPASDPAPESPGADEPEVDEPAAAPGEDVVPVQMPKIKKRKSRFYIGGWLGASGGEAIDLVELAPEVGYQITPKFHIGGSLIYRYRKDKRFDPDLTTRNIGGSLFGRYFVYGPLFAQLGTERITWDYIVNTPEGPDTLSADHTAILLGPGFALPMGPNAATYFTVLYDVNYNSDGPNPYDRPWFIRIGVGVGL